MSTPETFVVTDHEFIFLGGAKLSHTLGPDDSFEDLGDRFHLRWSEGGEDAFVYKAQLLQHGRRVRTVSKVAKTAVQQAIEEIQAREARKQGVQLGTPASPTSPAGQ